MCKLTVSNQLHFQKKVSTYNVQDREKYTVQPGIFHQCIPNTLALKNFDYGQFYLKSIYAAASV